MLLRTFVFFMGLVYRALKSFRNLVRDGKYVNHVNPSITVQARLLMYMYGHPCHARTGVCSPVLAPHLHADERTDRVFAGFFGYAHAPTEGDDSNAVKQLQEDASRLAAVKRECAEHGDRIQTDMQTYMADANRGALDPTGMASVTSLMTTCSTANAERMALR